MNICNDGGSILTFHGPRLSRNEIEPEYRQAADPVWLDYCRAREIRERAAAKNASSVQAQRVHQQLAMAYASAIRRGTRS